MEIKINKFKSFSILSLSAFAFCEGCGSLPYQKPNVIIVITDDQGRGDLGCYGNTVIKTPNIDTFYSEAVRFDNFHVSTTSAPSRSSLMTGRHCNRVNCFHTISGRSILFEDETVMPQVFAENGYETGMYGKWHLGDNYPYRAEDRGFQNVVRHAGGGVGQMPDYWGNDYFDDTYFCYSPEKKQTEPVEFKGYCTDVFFSEAIRFITKKREKPFFCYIALNAPHTPLNLPEKYYDLYAGEKRLRENQKRFYGMVTNIDDNFGRLQKALADNDLEDNTILIFMTDNGTADGRPVMADGMKYGHDGGLRGAKGSVYEGGHRVPFMIRWPAGSINGGKDITELASHYDILPTFIDLINLRFNASKPLDGISLVPLLRGQKNKWPDRVLIVDTQRTLNLVKNKSYAVMDEEWRLVNGTELYRIGEDLAQENNIISEHPETAKRLYMAYEKWWESLDAENLNSRYAYIKAGTQFENPVKVCSHDLVTGKYENTWHQFGAAMADQTSGIYKIEFASPGEYTITLRRFPRESGLGFNDTFGDESEKIEIADRMPASVNPEFKKAYLYVAGFEKTAPISENDKEITFRSHFSEGKYDVDARLYDKDGRCYPAYFMYIGKISDN